MTQLTEEELDGRCRNGEGCDHPFCPEHGGVDPDRPESWPTGGTDKKYFKLSARRHI